MQLLVTAKRQMQEYYKVIEVQVLSKLPKGKVSFIFGLDMGIKLKNKFVFFDNGKFTSNTFTVSTSDIAPAWAHHSHGPGAY